MNHKRVQIFREKLDNFTVSDYYGLNSPGLTCYLNSVLQVLFMTDGFREEIQRHGSRDAAHIDAHLEGLFANLKRKKASTHSITKMLGITDLYEQRDAAEYFENILRLTSPEASKEQGFKAFFKGETVCEDNVMFCNHCDEKREVEIDCEIAQSPEVLTLLLKRFSFDSELRRYVKLQCKVDVPQTLHVKSSTYNLYALVHHLGDLAGGHYTAEIRSFETGRWYSFNDDVVKMVRQSLFEAGNTHIRSRTAYLLMYRKAKGAQAPEKLTKASRKLVLS